MAKSKSKDRRHPAADRAAAATTEKQAATAPEGGSMGEHASSRKRQRRFGHN
ncbi:hypothetical protein [Streptomyces lonarensis]|uniref:Uncharacterized protein n=1 Tax=Streptomyces lonarensis TaxID=700599 RepID=A0A7X6HZP2_9ACTN|nr:hypothetical protein [Streptomyces lonarensis]NJQ06705.1 hypothetical protein [Streptomyces lonarensis]